MRATSLGLIMVAALAFTGPVRAQEVRLPAPLVYLSEIDATIEQDIRYATAGNFTGHALPGYEAGECILSADTARALVRVQRSVVGRGLSLKVYDCYRPRRAVAAMMEWARSEREEPGTQRFHPRIPKRDLRAQGYIAGRSEHSRGIVVDLTLVDTNARASREASAHKPQGACNAPRAQRAHDGSVDMGTDFDCFDPMSNTRASGLTPDQRASRELLIAAMEREGFANYSSEWWHFRYAAAPPGVSFDVPIRAGPPAAGGQRR